MCLEAVNVYVYLKHKKTLNHFNWPQHWILFIYAPHNMKFVTSLWSNSNPFTCLEYFCFPVDVPKDGWRYIISCSEESLLDNLFIKRKNNKKIKKKKKKQFHLLHLKANNEPEKCFLFILLHFKTFSSYQVPIRHTHRGNEIFFIFIFHNLLLIPFSLVCVSLTYSLFPQSRAINVDKLRLSLFTRFDVSLFYSSS